MAKYEDTYLHQGRRKALIDLLRTKGISNEKVLIAMMKVPRHYFFNATFELHAYDDKAFPIAAGQTISQPYTVAFQTQLLDLNPTDKVLEIGTGSGYQACVLAACGARVFSIERQKQLYDQTKTFIAEIGFAEIKCFYGDGYAGLPSYAPFDKIIITAAAPKVPEALLQQLKIGGWLVIPVGEEITLMKKITRLTEDRFEEKEFSEFRFVPMLGGKEK